MDARGLLSRFDADQRLACPWGRLVAYLAVGLLAVAVLLSVRPGPTANARPRALPQPFGNFASYSWRGLTRSVAASWVVPQILDKPASAATAFTWIGAYGPNNAFIQVGIETDTQEARGRWRNVYIAAWSDTRKTDHLAPLFTVRPGDAIRARLRHVGHAWLVSLSDQTSGQRYQFLTTQEGRPAFHVASWVQEHSALGDGKQVAYPDLSRLSFSSLEVDGEPPRYSNLRASWMSLHGSYLAPSPLVDDRWTVVPAQVSAAGAYYLAAVLPLDAASIRLNALLDAPLTTAKLPAIRQAATANARILRSATAALQAYTWPTAVAPLIRDLQRQNEASLRWCLQGQTRTLRGLDAWAASSPLFPRQPPLGFGHAIRRALGVPDSY
jgi:hypothetical protein